MKKTIVFCLCVALLACAVPALGEQPFRVVTSFYPMYLLTANVVANIEGVELTNMTAQETGCLHDYQLLPGDMRALEGASAFVINGAGMEQFLDKVIAQYGTMPIIDSSEGIALIYGEHLHAHGDDSHGHGEEMPNAHVWLDPRNAAIQVRNIGEGLAQADPARAARYFENAEAYAARLEALYVEMNADLEPLQDRRLVTFHEAFPYFAGAFGFEIIASLHLEAEAQPSTRDLAILVDTIKAEGIRALFTEPQYDAKAADIIQAETGAQIYVLDPIVTGELHPNAYEDTMWKNVETLKEALGQ